ncbi:phosphoribosylanthranilate isomerase [Flavobacterium sp. IMCC34852]|uniref:N-(5'-phosphoribosyl)anthranilate isomerase n=2 Tax=Flavobacterium rivulicola TaxID=2732161 RepID=A0A7Y3R9I1_9FLAO|nr:phosphoribosylanthranilate isomerase [Flavobacterium sp. IMCC34852]
MKFPENIVEIAAFQPDYLGFIFYEKSPRNFDNKIPELDKSIQKVGVFVDASFEEIEKKVNQYKLDLVQLHGDESPGFCSKIETNLVKVIKSFSIDNQFNFKDLEKYKSNCSYYLFDTKGANYGGNGTSFDWQLLAQYNLDKPYFLSGGIGTESITELKEFLKKDYAKNCTAIDLNSQFETEPGLKKPGTLKLFLQNLKE